MPFCGCSRSRVVFLTSDNIETILLSQRWLNTAWDLANLYLSSVGADLLADGAPALLGLSEETTCYVSTEYFVIVGESKTSLRTRPHMYFTTARGEQRD
jgi:hypothetical protein